MTILVSFFLAAFVYQLVAWVGVLGRVSESDLIVKSPQNKSPESPLPPVSIIICFRNEEERLKRYLPLILKQDYPDFEVIAVNDFSTDNSGEVVRKFADRYPALRLVQPLKPTRPGKKDALTYGIEQAKNHLLLLTDADCAPVSGHWIRKMTAGFSHNHIDVILGYSPYCYRADSVNAFQRYETIYTALQYFGFARVGMPYMGVGRNLAYRKSFFSGAGGVASHAHLPGGDDDLLISRNAEAAKTSWVIDSEAWTLSDPAMGWRDYLKRKFRHVGVGGHYPLLPKLLLGGLGASHFGIYLCGFIGLNTDWVLTFLTLLALRWIVIVLVIKYSPFIGKKSDSRQFSVWGIICNDALLALYYLILLPAPFLGGRQKGGWE